MERRLLALRLTGLGWYVGSCIGIGVAGGHYLDLWLGLEPVLTLLGFLLGITAAFYGFFKMIQPLIRPERSGEPVNKPRNDGGNP